MLSLRSARSRAVLASVVLVVLLASIATLAVWRTRDMQQQHQELEHTSAVAFALESAQAQFWETQATLAALILLGDPSLVDDYHDTVASLEQNLSQARTHALAEGEADEVLALDALTERIGHFIEQVNLALPIVLEADPEMRVQLATASMSGMVSEAEAIIADLHEMAQEEQQEFAATRAAADRAADATLWLLIGFSATAFMVAIGTIATLIVSVVRPLASLRASARAITSGDLEARAKVSGPEEVASLAHDFNAMTDALSAKTEALQESERHYRLLAENASDVIWTIDMNLRYTYVSPSVTRLRGYSVEEVMGGTMAQTLTPASREVAMKALAEELAIEKMDNKDLSRTRTLELELNCRDGSTVWTEIKTTFLRDEDDRAVGILGVTRDITERKRAEEALVSSEERLRILFEFAPDAYYLNDLQGNFVDGNKAAEEIVGYSREELIGKNMLELKLLPPEQIPKAAAALAKHVRGLPSGPDEFALVRKDGSQAAVEIRSFPVKIGEQTLVLGIARDITERKRAEEERERLHAELEVRAVTDSLTGLYDHAHFYERLTEEIERSKRYKHGFAVVMMDVDDFKRFNDSRSHQAGDEALRLVGYCIRSGLRRPDIAFRYGGDEFAAILVHADSSKARAVVDRINGRIARGLKQMDGDSLTRLSLSAGVACFPDDGTTADDLVRIADAALYSAKWVARARDVMGQREDIQSLVSALVSRRGGVEGPADGAIFRPEALHEQHARIVSSVASSIVVALKDAGVAQALEDPDLQIVAVVGAASEIKDPYIRGHQERTSEGAVALAGKMGLPPDRVRDIRIAGLLHDIGKVTVSEGILNKPGKLTRREFDSIKEHPIVGATLVSQVRGFERLVPILRHHHERFDGKGYPDGLAGEEIPLEARILSVADVFDAMTHERSYRKALSKAEAIAELERGAGTQFDPALVEAFLALIRRRGDETAAPAQAASEDRQLAAARVRGREKG